LVKPCKRSADVEKRICLNIYLTLGGEKRVNEDGEKGYFKNREDGATGWKEKGVGEIVYAAQHTLLPI